MREYSVDKFGEFSQFGFCPLENVGCCDHFPIKELASRLPSFLPQIAPQDLLPQIAPQDLVTYSFIELFYALNNYSITGIITY